MSNVVAMGEALIDFTMQSADHEGYPTMEAHAGGAPLNYLATLSKYGAKTAMLAKVGGDTFGELLKGSMEAVGIDISGVKTDKDVFTTMAFVTLKKSGEREFAFARKPGADTMLKYEELDLSLIDKADVFHFGTVSLTDEPMRTATKKAVEYAKAKGKIISFDPNLRAPLWADLEDAKRQMEWGLSKADIVKISIEEIEFLFDCMDGKGAEKCLVDYNAKLVFVTLGKQGAYFATRKCTGYVKIPQGITSVDTTGAGDIFGGAAMYGVLESAKQPQDLTREELQRITAFACTAASLSTQSYGSMRTVPDISAVNAALAL
ncbi:MAG: carbohydrate kinase [Oscillospiraceae bacterium]